jgi:hypothetical protein
MKRGQILLFVALLGAWLGAITKTNPDPDPDTPTPGAKRILFVDGAKTQIYPQTLGLKLMGAQILKALKDLEAQAESLETMGEALSEGESRLQSVEGAIQ